MRLYKISESEVLKILESSSLSQGKNTIVREIEGFKYPIKIVVVNKDELTTVVTAYPVKKGIEL